MSGHREQAVGLCEVCGLAAEPEPFDLNGPVRLCLKCAGEALSVLREVKGRIVADGPRVQTVEISPRGAVTAGWLAHMLGIYQETELVAARTQAIAVAHSSTMLACRCHWEMKRRGPLWVCENWRPWNFWKHDVTVRTPTRRSPCM